MDNDGTIERQHVTN